MRVRLVHVTVKRSGARALREEIVERDLLQIGRGTDNQLQIPGLTVALHHATLAPAPSGVRIDVREASSLLVNGAVCTGAALNPGDVVRIGQHELRVGEPDAGEDAVLEVEQVAVSGSERDELARRTRIGVERGLLSRRVLSLLAAGLVLGALLVVPILGMRASKASDPGPAVAPATERLTAVTWNVGQISRHHAMIADRCQACHAQPFAPVRNEECLACHRDLGAHYPPDHADVLADARCTECHQEHRGDAALTGFGDRLCVGCHGDLHAVAPATTIEDVRGFASQHPDFRPLVLLDATRADRRRVPLAKLLLPGQSGAGAPAAVERERSGLRFPHRKHLEGAIRSPHGPKQLKCESCHTVADGGASMTKVSFAEHCQPCHSLAFDERYQAREVPHADPKIVRDAIYEFYSARALEALDGAANMPPARRRPGEIDDARARARALQQAREWSDQAAAILLGDQGACAQCHTMTGEIEDRTVAPVRLVPLSPGDRWLPLGGFTHARLEHRECETCHAAALAESSEVVILPGIDKCRACHGDEIAPAGLVGSPCLSCHEFHVPAFGPMRAELAGRAPRAEDR